jgi:hypothetical protein
VLYYSKIIIPEKMESATVPRSNLHAILFL